MKRNTTSVLSLFACALLGFAQTGVQFGSTAEKEATVEKVAPLLDSPQLSAVDTLCKQVAADGLNDALVRTKLYMLGQAVSAKGSASKHLAALETLYAKYAKESASPVQQLFFVEQLRWIGTKSSLPVIKELCGAKDVNIAASANMTRQAIEAVFDPVTQVFPLTKMRQLTNALDKANDAEKFRLLTTALQSKGDLRYQAFAIRSIGSSLSPEYLKKWCDLTSKCDDPQVAALLIHAMGTYQKPVVFELLLEMCGDVDAAVSTAALDVLATRDPKVLKKALPARLANVNADNYKSFATFLTTLPAEVVVPALTTAYPKQNDLGKQLIFETLTAQAGSEGMVKAALGAATNSGSDKKLAKAAFRYLRQSAGPNECEKLLLSLSTAKGSLQSEAVQAYAMAARRPGNAVYNKKLLESLKKGGSTPSATLLEAAGRSGEESLLAYVCTIAPVSKDALRALSTWREGLAAPYMMQALAKQPADKFLLRGVRQQLQNTKADTSELKKGWKALAASGSISKDDLSEFAVVINHSANIALNCPVKATRPQQGAYAPAQMVDGNTANGHGYHGSDAPVEITVDLQSMRTVAAAHLYFYADGGRYYQYRIDTSIDNKSWKSAIDKTSDTSVSKAEGFVLTFEPREARYVKLTVTKNSANPAVHVNELMLFSAAGLGMLDPEKVKAPQPKPDAEGFYTLFDGSNLDAWKGNKTAYYINENKEIAVDPSKGGSGNFYTAKEYGNFIFRFEFKLTPGANNGIGVRTPMGVSASYNGFEIQVLDDTAKKYDKLQPYQYHGSVYGLIPAKRGSQKPVGEWNTEEIVMDGRHVKVTVNGKVIVDADLDEATKDGTMDKKDHPGLKRSSGNISFCGHGDKLWYRNVKVKPIKR
jgi:hypothetical protein